jgi:hypothetical protein
MATDERSFHSATDFREKKRREEERRRGEKEEIHSPERSTST